VTDHRDAVLIRDATTDDARGVVDVFLEARRGMTYLPQDLHTEAETREYLTGLLATVETLIAERGDQVVGFLVLEPDHVGHFYVGPDAQGLGIGTLLFDEAKRRRPGGFGLWVFQRNEGARRFYERHGCRVVLLTDGEENEEHEPDALYEWRP
jgi:ribosomal protein S18 acetylase RimI-like enzyme